MQLQKGKKKKKKDYNSTDKVITPKQTHTEVLPVFLKGIVHPKIKIMSSFTHPQVVPNLYEFLCSAEHKGRYFEESL